MEQMQKFLIYRKEGKESPVQYQRFEVPIGSGMSVLEALFYIQDYFDSTLAFRYSCRGAICGSCGMTINKFPRLACRTLVSRVDKDKRPRLPELILGDVPDWDEKNEILIEPLPNLNVVKDLVVDMDSFWKFYREVRPYFSGEWGDIAPENKQSPDDARAIEHLIYCILCGLCWVCPVISKNKQYLGPAALGKSYRFVADTRLSEENRREIIDRVMRKDGVPACEKIFACNRICPKKVGPGTAIDTLRKL